jgi:hypothetical protein
LLFRLTTPVYRCRPTARLALTFSHLPPALSSAAQAAILEPHLVSYLDTLIAVHGGADLRSASDAVLGYTRPAVKGGRHGSGQAWAGTPEISAARV